MSNVRHSSLYTWDVYKPKEADTLGFEFIPQLWGGAQDKIDAFTSVVKAGYANYVLGFNECVIPII